jgi:hypothetical protein
MFSQIRKLCGNIEYISLLFLVMMAVTGSKPEGEGSPLDTLLTGVILSWILISATHGVLLSYDGEAGRRMALLALAFYGWMLLLVSNNATVSYPMEENARMVMRVGLFAPPLIQLLDFVLPPWFKRKDTERAK